VVGNHGQDLTGLRFYKMSGSGNDFVFLDGRDERALSLETTDTIRRLCARGTGVGADGVVWLQPARGAAFRMRYRNADGSLADMCGNAALCSVSLAVRLGIVDRGTSPFEFETDAGRMTGRLRPDGLPEVRLTPIRGLAAEARDIPKAAGEGRIGFADSGVPHLVVEVADADAVDLPVRGRELRHAAALGPQGANVNFISRTKAGSLRMRTYERGVEGETLACGTGAAATGVIARAWGLTNSEASVETTSGRRLLVSIHEGEGGITPSLAGEGRLVYEGIVGEL
jgi:diaminopimelate epimerase